MTASAPPLTVVRAKTLFPLAGERLAKGEAALNAPLERIEDGVLVAQGGIILAVESFKTYTRRPGSLPRAAISDLGEVGLAPGLVNCHTHLEISHMAGQTCLGSGFPTWLKSLIALDKNAPPTAASAADAAVRALAAHGTAAVGDISSRTPDRIRKALHTADIQARIFCEVIGSREEHLDNALRTVPTDPAFSLAGHALYTTPPHMFRQAKAWCASHRRPFSMHLAEHADEEECLREGRGALYDMVRPLLPDTWRAPGLSPVQYAARLGLLAPDTVAVHCVRCTPEDITTLAASGAAICLCPRSNAAIGVGQAPARAYAAHGIPLTLGTDSLASNTDLDVWNEALFFLQKNIFSANALLRMATVNGAAVLGLGDAAGRLEKGRRFCYTPLPSEIHALFR